MQTNKLNAAYCTHESIKCHSHFTNPVICDGKCKGCGIRVKIQIPFSRIYKEREITPLQYIELRIQNAMREQSAKLRAQLKKGELS